MSDTLIGKRVSISDPYLLQFFYPRFSVVPDLSQPIDYSKGVIYTGLISESTLQKLTWMTKGMFIVISSYGDIVLEKPQDFITHIFPKFSDIADKYSDYPLEEFIPVFKQYWLLQRRIIYYKEENHGVYALYRAMSSSKNEMYAAYFSLLERAPIHSIISSVLTFIQRVQTQNYDGASSEYKISINKAYLKFGSKIDLSVLKYIKSNQSPEIALLFFMEDLLT